MPIFSYHPRSTLCVGNECLKCDEDRYLRLINKNKITDEHRNIIQCLNRYRLLTIPLMSKLLNIPSNILKADLKNLETYGIVIRQYYQYESEGEKKNTPTFFCLSAQLPFKIESDRSNMGWIWNKDLRIEDAMAILNFNLFHAILRTDVPHRAIQAQLNYKLGNLIVNGRYKLKSRKFYKGYSHCMVLSSVDFSESNKRVVNDIIKIWEFRESTIEKIPWIIVICENNVQAIHIKESIPEDILRDHELFFVFCGEMEFNESPFEILQAVSRNGEKIISENYIIENWY